MLPPILFLCFIFFFYLAILNGGLISAASPLVVEPDPDGSISAEVFGSIVDSGGHVVAVAEHPADHLGLGHREVVVANGSPDAIVPDFNPARGGRLPRSQTDLHKKKERERLVNKDCCQQYDHYYSKSSYFKGLKLLLTVGMSCR